jgi:diguanylate cyclase
MLDIDHFKEFNDQWGHLAGDQALRTLAYLVREHLRPDDLVARFGGEEFLILLPQTSLQQAEEIANRLRHCIATTPCNHTTGDKLPAITVSMGLTILNSNDISRSLLERVDRALYLAKKAGRNRVVSQ